MGLVLELGYPSKKIHLPNIYKFSKHMNPLFGLFLIRKPLIRSDHFVEVERKFIGAHFEDKFLLTLKTALL